jgi:hypothetical protein
MMTGIEITRFAVVFTMLAGVSVRLAISVHRFGG